MKMMDLILKSFQEGRKRAYDKAYRRRKVNTSPIEIVEPSIGKEVAFQVTAQDDDSIKLDIELLIAFAKSIEQCGVQYKVTGKVVQLTLPDNETADMVRKAWKK